MLSCSMQFNAQWKVKGWEQRAVATASSSGGTQRLTGRCPGARGEVKASACLRLFGAPVLTVSTRA